MEEQEQMCRTSKFDKSYLCFLMFSTTYSETMPKMSLALIWVSWTKFSHNGLVVLFSFLLQQAQHHCTWALSATTWSICSILFDLENEKSCTSCKIYMNAQPVQYWRSKGVQRTAQAGKGRRHTRHSRKRKTNWSRDSSQTDRLLIGGRKLIGQHGPAALISLLELAKGTF